ncbi:uncharacterized protein PHACADRAFT_211082 [Phanerochaete carnosa HHB-10118-sp]|uniref:Uncharacterized protein n=1 Tax=Phanerochaete carnosa (strain HHB-10118-sp) TaxID=650164 RepID=K5W396_PHACS|nr:uncharacterized protein PHACADRAFT_211082 [Phanerochaete carnosa HHB-10118-sp]EKM53384.1 hypothetical protein PHACADRAFT_211082 [Phanerochaete carnosa HHB-10118-sp]
MALATCRPDSCQQTSNVTAMPASPPERYKYPLSLTFPAPNTSHLNHHHLISPWLHSLPSTWGKVVINPSYPLPGPGNDSRSCTRLADTASLVDDRKLLVNLDIVESIPVAVVDGVPVQACRWYRTSVKGDVLATIAARVEDRALPKASKQRIPLFSVSTCTGHRQQELYAAGRNR